MVTLAGGCSQTADNADTPPSVFGQVREHYVTDGVGFQFTHFGATSSAASAPLPHFSQFCLDTPVGVYPCGTLSWHPIPNAQAALTMGGGTRFTGIGATSWDGHNRLDAFYVSASGTVAHSFSADKSTTWGNDDWGKPAGYNLYGQVGVAAWGPNRVDVFVFGKTASVDSDLGTGNTLFHRYFHNGVASGWDNLGSAEFNGQYVDMGLTAVSWGANRIDVFAQRAPQFSGFQHWFSTNGTTFGKDNWSAALPVSGAPDVASWGDQRLDLYYRDWNNSTRHIWWDHGASGEDDWGKPCPTTNQPLLGASAGAGGWLMPSRPCNNGGGVPGDGYVHYWAAGVHAWAPISPPTYQATGTFEFARYGDGAIVITD